MTFAFELFFDPATDRQVRSSWRLLAEVSGSHYMDQNAVRPHIALAVVQGPSEKALHGWRKIISADKAPVLEEVGRGSFTSCVSFVRFHRTTPLLALHSLVMSFCDQASLKVLPHYRTDSWVPHCTLAQNFSSDRVHAVESLAQKFIFTCPWTVTSVGIVSFPPTVTIDEEKYTANQTPQTTPASSAGLRV